MTEHTRLRLARDIPLEPRTLSATDTAIGVLDLTRRCDAPGDNCSELIPRLRGFLDRAREAGVPIVFSSNLRLKDTPEGEIAEGLARRPDEPVIFPDSYDKLHTDEMTRHLDRWGVRNLVLVGAQTNVCIMYTATTASRVHRYQVVIPVDGTNAHSDERYDYALYQLTVLPPNSVPIEFSRLADITFDPADT